MGEIGAQDGFELIMLQQRVEELQRLWSMAKTQIRNAITDLEDGEEDDAIETLKQLVGDE